MTSMKLAFATAVLILATAATAQPQGGMPDDIAWKIQEIGHVVDAAKTAAIYQPLQRKESYSGVKVERDIKYGPADRNVLDVFTADAQAKARPVLIFVHGGGFTGGEKRGANGSAFYDNVALWATTNGFVGVNIDYRLAPGSQWPSGAEDLAAAVQWVAANIATRGGDPTRIYLMGHSAGAAHVASYVSHPEFFKVKDGGLKGAIMVSGIYDLTGRPLGAPEKAYFGEDPAHRAEQSALKGLLATKIPLMIVSAELDPPVISQQFELLKKESCNTASGCARAVRLPQHSHMSEVYAINSGDTGLTDQILDFVKTEK